MFKTTDLIGLLMKSLNSGHKTIFGLCILRQKGTINTLRAGLRLSSIALDSDELVMNSLDHVRDVRVLVVGLDAVALLLVGFLGALLRVQEVLQEVV